MAIERLTERLPRLPEVAQIRTGGERGTGHGGRGKVLDHFRLTTPYEDIAHAAHLALGVVAGGAEAGGLDSLPEGSTVQPFTPTNRAGEPTGNEGWQVELGRQLAIMIPPVQYEPFEEGMVLFGTGGIKRRCDGQTCWIPGEEGRRPCVCAGIPDDDDKTPRCEQQTRFSFVLLDIRLGITNFYTKSTYAREALGGILGPIMEGQRRGHQDGDEMFPQIPAWLFMVQKTANRAAARTEQNPRGKTRFWSPVLMPIITPRQMMGAETRRLFEAGPRVTLLPVPEDDDVIEDETFVDSPYEPDGSEEFLDRIEQATVMDDLNAIWVEAGQAFPKGSAQYKELFQAFRTRAPQIAKEANGGK